MKKYVILTSSIIGIGGAQLYTRNKLNFLKERGWEVEVLSFSEGDIVFNELKEYEKSIVRALYHVPPLHTEKFKDSLIKKYILDGEYDEIIIESHTIHLAIWGEVFAEKVKGKHLVFLLTEKFKRLSVEKMKFLDFKHSRKELASISDKSLELLFKDFKTVKDEERYVLKATGSNNVVEDVPNEIIDSLGDCDVCIGTITRLEKDYVMPLLEEIIKFADRNKQLKVRYIIVGGSKYESVRKKIEDRASECSNLELIITGYLFPIPRSVFSKADIFIGTAGGAGVPYREGVLTISVDCNTAAPIGIMGYNTKTSLYADGESNLNLQEMLDDILIYNKYAEFIKSECKKKIVDINDVYKDFERHIEFIKNSDKNNDYFNMKDIKPLRSDYIKRLISLKITKKILNKLSV